HLARHNGRWADEWGNADMTQAATRPGLTRARRTALCRQGLAACQRACTVDDLLGDARVYRGQAYQALGMYRQAAASYLEGLKIGGFEVTMNVDGVPLPSAATAAVGLVSTLAAEGDYPALVKPVRMHLDQNYETQSPMTLAYSPTLGLISTPPFS